jgi:hypothetical protein
MQIAPQIYDTMQYNKIQYVPIHYKYVKQQYNKLRKPTTNIFAFYFVGYLLKYINQ